MYDAVVEGDAVNIAWFAGVTLFDAALSALLPIALVAYTLNVYVVPLVSPEILIVPDPDVAKVPVILPGVDTAV